MAYKFETLSGAVYTVRDGRITRDGDQPVWSFNTGDRVNVGDGIVNEPFRFVGNAPTMGERFRFTMPGQPENSPISTSPVVDRWEVDADGEPTGFDALINAAWDEYERAGEVNENAAMDDLFALAAQARQALAAKV